MLDTRGTGKVPPDKLAKIVNEIFDFRPARIIQYLDLLRPIYKKTACYGHFGRSEPEFTWEQTNRVDELKKAAGVK
jgi:S-adenosylmethionine synthetase